MRTKGPSNDPGELREMKGFKLRSSSQQFSFRGKKEEKKKRNVQERRKEGKMVERRKWRRGK